MTRCPARSHAAAHPCTTQGPHMSHTWQQIASCMCQASMGGVLCAPQKSHCLPPTVAAGAAGHICTLPGTPGCSLNGLTCAASTRGSSLIATQPVRHEKVLNVPEATWHKAAMECCQTQPVSEAFPCTVSMSCCHRTQPLRPMLVVTSPQLMSPAPTPPVGWLEVVLGRPPDTPPGWTAAWTLQSVGHEKAAFSEFSGSGASLRMFLHCGNRGSKLQNTAP